MTKSPVNASETSKDDVYFATDHLKQDLKGRSVRGGAISVLSGLVSFGVGLMVTPFLARLLSPDDFGLIAMIAVFTGLILLFKEMGLATATVQKDHITHEQVSTLFWINVAISTTVMLTTMAISPLVAWFYDKPILIWIMIASAPGQLISGLAIQHLALLRRQMQFTALAKLNISAQIVAAIVGVTLAWQGFGVWSLIAMPMTNACVTVLGVWFICKWRPGKPVRGSGVKPLLKFGGHLTGFNAVNYFSRNFDNLLIGKLYGSGSLGLYTKAYSLLMLPIRQINGPITSVAVPALSRLQEMPDQYVRYYQRAVELLVFIGMPIVAFAAVDTDNIIRLILGAQWTDAVPFFQALAPAAFIGTFNVATGWVYISRGTTGRQFRIGIVTSIITTVAFIIGAAWHGPLGVAVAFSTAKLVMDYPVTVYCFHGTPIKMRHLLSILWRPTVCAIAAGGTVFQARYLIPNNLWLNVPNAFLLGTQLLRDMIVYALAYPLLWFIVPGGKLKLTQIIQLAREFKPKSKS